ncbi:MAG: hypothetical protein RIQ62_790 [Bacteroidota bacterium]
MPQLSDRSRFAGCGYFRYGKGPLIVLLHGFGEDSRIWQYQVEVLQHHYTVVVPDLPGSGQSPLPQQPLHIERMADMVKEILDQEDCQQTILLGHSMGGYITLAFAEKYPEYLQGFGLIHSTAYADDEAKKETRRKAIRLIRNEGKTAFLRAMIPNLYGEKAKQNNPSDIEAHFRMALETSEESLIAAYEAMILRPDRTTVLRNAKVPVLFVIGERDNAVPPLHSFEQCSLPNISSVSFLSDCGHTGMFEVRNRMNTILHSFCEFIFG